MTETPVSLRVLLADEIEERLAQLERSPGDEGVLRSALHALRGSSGVAGEHDLWLVLGQFHTRLAQGQDVAFEAIAMLSGVAARLRSGTTPFEIGWPEPPPHLQPTLVPANYRAEYIATMQTRLRELEEATASDAPEPELAQRAYRSVHAIKGAANAVGDDATAWYCHGLETWLRSGALDREEFRQQVERQRWTLQLLIQQPEQALEYLRRESENRGVPSGAAVSDRPSRTPRSTRPPAPEDDLKSNDLLLHVRGSVIDGCIDRLEHIDRVHTDLTGVADMARASAGRLRELRSNLYTALRLIGPPRPWGAPARALRDVESASRALGSVAENAERGARACRRNAELIRSAASEVRADLASLRRTNVGWLFERVANAAERLASARERLIEISISGADVAIDRRVAERLFDPVMQLVQNAVAHGIQSPAVRARAGQPPAGKLMLGAARVGDWLRIVIEDDGAGVDVERLRELATAQDVAAPEILRDAPADELLSLLFVPGLTTRTDADLLAGRGFGLDLARDAVRRLGGAIRLARRPGGGLTATIEVASERGVLDVVWLEAAGTEFALPVSFAGNVARLPVSDAVAPLAACVGLAEKTAPALALELVIPGVQRVFIGVQAVSSVEETNVRPVPALVAAVGPYSGAVLRRDGSLRLALDATLLAARAWALAAPS